MPGLVAESDGAPSHDVTVKTMSPSHEHKHIDGMQYTNGTSRQYSSHNETSFKSSASSSTTHKSTSTTVKRSVVSHQTILRETIISTRRKLITSIDIIDDAYIDSMTLDGFLSFVERERITTMPPRGSYWDYVLKWAEFIALQISLSATAASSFEPASETAAQIIWAGLRSMLQLGPENAHALLTIFSILYELARSLSALLRHSELLQATSQLRGETSQALAQVVCIVETVSIVCQNRVRYGHSKESSVDIGAVIGPQRQSFYERKRRVVQMMWEYALSDDRAAEVSRIQAWLQPRGVNARSAMQGLTYASRAEQTCEWLQRRLLDFSRSSNDVFHITGPAGCGKSTLYDWTLERLQRPLGKKNHLILAHKVEFDKPTQSTPLAIAKSLARQLLEKAIGDVTLFDGLLKGAAASTLLQQEDILWSTLDLALQNSHASFKDELIILIDGLEEGREASSTAAIVRDRVVKLAAKHTQVKAIIFAQDQDTKAKSKSQFLHISADLTHGDIRKVATTALNGHEPFDQQDEFAQEQLVDRLCDAAKGDYLWINFTIANLRKEHKQESFNKAAKAASEHPQTTNKLIEKVISGIDMSHARNRLLLSWIMIADRPLTFAEIDCLMQVDIGKKALVKSDFKAGVDLQNIFGRLLRVDQGQARLRHATIYRILLQYQKDGQKLFDLRHAQTDFATRLLAYCKFSVTEDQEPIFEPPTGLDIARIFEAHPLMSYAIKNWVAHFRSSSCYKSSESLDLSAELKSVFPSSTRLAILEWSLWSERSLRSVALTDHELALHIRQQVFGQQQEVVLQNMIICGNLYKLLSNQNKACSYFYNASMIGQKFTRLSTLTISCISAYLEITEVETYTTRTEIVTHKEIMLKLIISISKRTYGESSDIVIRYYKVLAQLYTDIHEESHAEATFREVQRIIIIRYGEGSAEETSIREHLTVVLRRSEKRESVLEYEENIFAIVRKLRLWDYKRIQLELELIISYEARGEFFLAERALVLLWQGLVEHRLEVHLHEGVEVYVHIIEVVLEYVRFLQRRRRFEEAQSILICIWSEYEEYEFESRELYLKIKIIAEIFRSMGLLAISISVFKKCWAWFIAHELIEESHSCEHLISIVTEEIITETTETIIKKSTTTTTTSTTVTETIMKELFESVIKRTVVTAESIKVCRTLIAYHMHFKQWTEVIKVARRSLTLIWATIISGGAVLALPREFGAEAIEIAFEIAHAHLHLHQIYEAEELFIRIYRACRTSCHFDDVRLTKSLKKLIAFYTEQRAWGKLIDVYRGTLIEYRHHCGASHGLTIDMLYLLGDLCREHGHGDALEFYEEIILTLNINEKFHEGAFRAMILISRLYYETGSWEKLLGICKMLWSTWSHGHHKHLFTVEIVEALYRRYRYLLEVQLKVEYEVLRAFVIEYHGAVVRFFKDSTVIIVDAMIELAEINIRHERHVEEAVIIYEEIIKTTTTTTTTTTTETISETTITNIKKQLTHAYTIVVGRSGTSTTVIEKAIFIFRERLLFLRTTLGWAHFETLVILQQLITAYLKINTKESLKMISHLLIESCIQILVTEKHSKCLFDAARVVAKLYLDCGMVEEGLLLLSELRWQIITKSVSSHERFRIKIGVIGKESFAFLTTFEIIIRGGLAISYAQVMAGLLVETVLYESYITILHSKEVKVYELLVQCARLRAYLGTRKRVEQQRAVELEVFEIFITRMGGSFKARREISFLYFVSILDELESESSISFVTAACFALQAKTSSLIINGQVQEAYEVAACGYHLIHEQGAFKHIENAGIGFKLSALLTLRRLKVGVTVDEKLRNQMLELSTKIIQEVIRVCVESKIDFTRMKEDELTELVGLLGYQKNYKQLEWLLRMLWQHRGNNTSWLRDPSMIIAIGSRYVQAKFLLDPAHPEAAIDLCEDISYNLSQMWGALDPKALEISDLLAQLYTTVGHHREAMGLHESLLRLVVEGDDDDDRTFDTMEAQTAIKHVILLRQSYQRLGGFDKSVSIYKDLVKAVAQMPVYKDRAEWKTLADVEKWDVKGKPDDALDHFNTPDDWDIHHVLAVGKKVNGSNGSLNGHGHGPQKRPGLGVKRVTSSWGMNFVHRLLHPHEEEHKPVITY